MKPVHMLFGFAFALVLMIGACSGDSKDVEWRKSIKCETFKYDNNDLSFVRMNGTETYIILKNDTEISTNEKCTVREYKFDLGILR